MKDYQPLLDKFPNGFLSFFTGKEYLGIPKEVIDYLDKYWLDKEELEKIWSPVKSEIFKGDCCSFPDRIFREDFELIFLKGGSLFDRELYDQLHSCITQTGDDHFVVVEDYDENDPPGNLPPKPGLIDWPPLHFKYQAGVSYDEILSGEFVSEELVLMSARFYFVFGDSGQWGIYAGNDYALPLYIIGFEKRYSELFHNQFIISEEKKQEVTEWIQYSIEDMKRWPKYRPPV